MCNRYRQMYCSWREMSSWKTNSLYLQRYHICKSRSALFSLSHSLPNAHTCRTYTNRRVRAHTHAQAFLVTLLNSSGSQGLLTDLAYFLEVELRQGMEPVRQLSEVEKLHLKPGKQEEGRRGEKERESVQLPLPQQWFVSHDYATVKKVKKVTAINCIKWVIFNPIPAAGKCAILRFWLCVQCVCRRLFRTLQPKGNDNEIQATGGRPKAELPTGHTEQLGAPRPLDSLCGWVSYFVVIWFISNQFWNIHH